MRSLVTWTYIAVLLVKSLLQLRFYMIFKQVHLQNRQDYPMAMVGMAHGQSMPSFLRWILQCFPVFFCCLVDFLCSVLDDLIQVPLQVPCPQFFSDEAPVKFLPFSWMKSYVVWFQNAQVNTVLMMNPSHIPNLPPFLLLVLYIKLYHEKISSFWCQQFLENLHFSLVLTGYMGLSENGIKPQVLAIKFHWLVINHETCS